MNAFDKILAALEMGTSILSSLPTPLAAGSVIASYLLKIVQAAVSAHETATGKPFDVTQLHQIQPLP